MKVSVVSAIAVLASVATSAATNQFLHLGRLVPPFDEADEFPVASASGVNVTGSSFFTQLLDHDDPSKGTFQQKFWWNAEYWAGPGSPHLWSQNATKPTVPWGVPCDRMEGSSYTGKGTSTDSCNVGIPAGKEAPNIDRRYVIDESIGSVSVLCVFQTMANAPDSHEFRLESGKLRYVHTMTVFKS